MPAKLNIGLSRKIGEENYGSRGASVNLEVELDSGMISDSQLLRDRMRSLYAMARQSVEEELRRSSDGAFLHRPWYSPFRIRLREQGRRYRSLRRQYAPAPRRLEGCPSGFVTDDQGGDGGGEQR